MTTTTGPAATLSAMRTLTADVAASEAAEVWARPGRLEADYAMPWGTTTGTMLVGFLVLEQAGHGWDIARGAGRPAAFDRGAVALADGWPGA